MNEEKPAYLLLDGRGFDTFSERKAWDLVACAPPEGDTRTTLTDAVIRPDDFPLGDTRTGAFDVDEFTAPLPDLSSTVLSSSACVAPT